MSLNPYEPSLVRSLPQRARRWPVEYLLIPLSWTAFICLTGIVADKVRYSSSLIGFALFAMVIASGAIVSLVCLKKCVRGWWHLLVLPIWLLLLSELWVLLLLTVRFLAVYFGGPR